MEGSNFYFFLEDKHPEEVESDEPTYYCLIISKEFWNAGEGLDCKAEPEELWTIIENLFGKENSDELMENVWEFWGFSKGEAHKKLLEAGFVENSDLPERNPFWGG